MTTTVTGVIAPVLTPFDGSGRLMTQAIGDSVEFAIECGCHAVVASGTGAQETAALTPEERKTVISETIDEIEERVPVLAGVSHPAQPVVTDLIEHAEQEDADGVLAMPPWGLSPDEDAILRYFADINATTDLPILVYNNPSVTVDMNRTTMAEVAALDGVAYMKESSRNWTKLGWLFERVHHAGLADLFTTMDVLLPTLHFGGAGAVVPPPASVPAMRIYEAYNNEDLTAAVAAQRTVGTFPPDEVDLGLTAVCKAASQLSGVDAGLPRRPYSSVSDTGRDAINKWMNRTDIPRINE